MTPLHLSKPRLDIDEKTALSFVENLERFSCNLSAMEQAILSALMHAAMDPWSRSLIDPPALTEDEASALDRAATAIAASNVHRSDH